MGNKKEQAFELRLLSVATDLANHKARINALRTLLDTTGDRAQTTVLIPLNDVEKPQGISVTFGNVREKIESTLYREEERYNQRLEDLKMMVG